MCILSVDEIPMVVGAGYRDYPASRSAIKQMSGSQGNWGRGVLCGMAFSSAGAAAASLSAGTSVATAVGASFGSAVCSGN